MHNKLGSISYEDLPLGLEQVAVVCEVSYSLFKMSSTVNFELILAIIECNKFVIWTLYRCYIFVNELVN